MTPALVKVDTVCRSFASPRLRVSITGSVVPDQVMVAGWPAVTDSGTPVMMRPAWAATMEARAARPKTVLMSCILAVDEDEDMD